MLLKRQCFGALNTTLAWDCIINVTGLIKVTILLKITNNFQLKELISSKITFELFIYLVLIIHL